MTNFEKIDDYLANRLPAEERAAFEQALEGDPALKSEVAFQEKIVSSVRQARAAELKQMLQQVPVPTGGWSTGQIAAGILAAGVVATSLYFYLSAPKPTPAVETITPEIITPQLPTEEKQPETMPETPVTAEKAKKETPAPAKERTVKPVQKPDLQVVDHAADITDTQPSEQPTTTSTRSEISVSKLEVVTLPPDKKYTFHYQFMEGKLRLYGPFDKNLYEILEINGDSHAVFLFYKENYYLLDESQNSITPLAPIRDGQLLKKLREYRSR